MSEFAIIPLAQIVASLTNPRTTFNPEKLTELAEDIKAMGVHAPVIVRPLPGARVADTDRKVKYELVAGERRLRASHIAGVPTIPAMVRALTDAEALKIQLVENVQREDLSELEEAEGIAKLMAETNISADAVADEIKKSRRHVFNRLKLLDLTLDCKQAMREGRIDASRAILIARIPDGKLQAKALEEACKQTGMHADQVMSVRAFQSWLQANVMLRLESATFQITDARLVKVAGSCKDCPKRTGADPDLFADVNSPDLCTDPVCYHGKESAHREAMVSKAEAKGMRLIEGKEAKEICSSHTSKLNGYLPLSQVREDATASGKGSKPATLRELLGKNAPSPVLIEHPVTKELIEAVPTEEAEALLVMQGLIKATQQESTLQKQAQSKIVTLQEQAKVKTEHAARVAVYEAAIDGIRATPDKQIMALFAGDVLRAWFEAQLDSMIGVEEMADLFGYTIAKDADEIHSVSMHIRACSATTLLRGLVIWMASDDQPNIHYRHKVPTIVDALTASLKLDTASIEKAAKAQVRAETAKQIKALTADLKANTTPALTTQSGTPSMGEGGEKAKEAIKPKSNNKTQAASPRNSKAKLTAAEAITGIADAMQNAEDQATTASPDAPVPANKSDLVEVPSDPLFDRAVKQIAHDRKVSVQLLKAGLGVGQAKAQQLIILLEQSGKVGAPNAQGHRTVLVAA